ncbi:lysoplasmalogenase [Emticicia fontis]
MPFRLVLIYILCCLIEIVGYRLYRDKLSFLTALPVLCLLIFYYLRRKGEYRLKDYTYSIGLFLAAVADIMLEVRNTTVKVLAIVVYMLSFSFYIATVRKEAVFGNSARALLSVIAQTLLIVSPVLLVFYKIPSDYFFASMIYMVFLALLYITALVRKTNKSSYQWFLSGALAFAVVTISEIYFSFIIRFPNGSILIKAVYSFAQFATFMGIIRTYKDFYPAREK